MPYTIYKISNDLNDKVYIGSTREPMKKRWSCHKSYAIHNFGDSELYREMRYLGVDHFKCEDIAYCDTLAGSLEAENRLIKEHNSIASGYNTNLPIAPQECEDHKKYVELTNQVINIQEERISKLKAVLLAVSVLALWKAIII